MGHHLTPYSLELVLPQDIALADALRGATLFRKVNVPILGLLENMSYHLCASCGAKSHIFGQDGGKRMAEREHMELLAQVLYL